MSSQIDTVATLTSGDQARGRVGWFTALRRIVVLGVACAVAACGIFDGNEEDEEVEGERISVLVFEEKLEVDPRLSQIEVVLPAPYENDSWPQPGGYATHAMHHLAADEELTEYFSVSAGEGSSSNARLTATPIVAEDKVFVLDSESQVNAIDAISGERLWRTDLKPKGEKRESGFGGGIAFGGNRVFVSSGFGFVAALDAGTGEELWRTNVRTPFRASPTFDAGRIFVSTYDDQLYAFAAIDGRVLWTHRAIVEPAGLLGASSPAVAGDVVVAPFSSGEIFAIRVENGRVTWTDALVRRGRMTPLSSINDIAGRPVIDQGRVYAVSHSGRLVSIDLRTGERVWTSNIASIQTPWVAGDFLYLLTTDAKLVCISTRQGAVRWIQQLRQYEDEEDREDPIVWSGPVLAGDRLVVVSSHGKARAISPYTGEVISKIDLPGPAFISPVVAKGFVYILTDEGELVALR